MRTSEISRKFGFGVLAVAGMLALTGTPATAVTRTWVGGTSATWSTAGNWDTGVPGATDIAQFSAATPTFQPTVTADASINAMTLTVNPSITVNSGTSQYTLTVTNATGNTGAAGITLKGAGKFSFTATGSNLVFGSNTITLDGGQFNLTGSEITINTTTGLPTGGGGADRTLLNDFAVTANGGRLGMNSGSGANGLAVAFNTLTLGGPLTTSSGGGGNGDGYTLAGTVTLMQDTARTLRFVNSTGHNGNDWIAGKITDGAGGAGNPLRFVISGRTLQIANATHDYAGGTIVEAGGGGAGYLDVMSNGMLGTGNLTVQSAGRIRLDNPTVLASAGNLAAGATITADAGSAVGVNASVNIADRFTATSSGVYGIEGARSYALDMSALGSGRMFLGSLSGGTYSGTNLTAGADATYRLGGGCPSGSLLTLLLTGANVLTGNNTLTVGSGLNSNASYGRTVITTNQDIQGAVLVNSDGFLVSRSNGGTPWGNAANAIVVHGTLALTGQNGGAGGVLNTAYAPTITLRSGATLHIDNQDTFNNQTATVNNDRWGDSTAIPTLNSVTFVYQGNRKADASETVGAVVFEGGSIIAIRKTANEGQDTLLTVASVTRQNGGTLVINPSAMANLGVDGANNVNERVVVTTPPPLLNGNTMVAPYVLGYDPTGANGTPNNSTFLTYDSNTAVTVSGTLGFKPATYTTTALNSAGAADIVNVTAATTLATNPTVYALRSAEGITASGGSNTVTVGSGTDPAGLILTGNGKTHSAIFDFGAREAIIMKAQGNPDVFTGGIKTSGGLTKVGPNQITLSAASAGNQSISGGVVIQMGTVAIGTTVVATDLADNLFTVNHAGRLNLNDFNLTLPGLAGSGLGGNVHNSSANVKALTIDFASGTQTYDGRLQASGTAANLNLVKNGNGTQVIGGACGHTGTTTVNAGALIANGLWAASTTAVTVNGSATLGGNGSLNRPVVFASNGTLAPGSSAVGTLGTGDLTLSATSLIAAELGVASASDTVAVTGALTLDGSVDITPVAGFGPGTYTLLTYTGALTNNGLEIGAKPAGFAATVDLSESGKVKLVLASSGGTVILLR